MPQHPQPQPDIASIIGSFKGPRRLEAARSIAAQLERQGFDFLRLTERLRTAISLSPTGVRQNVSGLPDPEFLGDIARIGRDLQESKLGTFSRAVGEEFIERATGGLIDVPDTVGLSERAETAAKITGDLLAIGAMAYGTSMLIGGFTALPRVATIVSGFPKFVRQVTHGGTIFGAIEATRPEGLPEDPSKFDLPARIGKFVEPLVGERAGLFVGGFVLGGAFETVLVGLAKGVSLAAETNMMRSFPDEAVPLIRDLLKEAGVEVGEGASKVATLRLFKANQKRIVLPESLAEVTAEVDSRLQYISQGMLNNPDNLFRNVDEGMIYLTELLRANPGGLSIARNMTLGRLEQAREVLNMVVITKRVGKHVAIIRPSITGLPTAAKGSSKEASTITRLIRAEEGGARPPEPVVNIFRDGSTVDGAFDFGTAAKELKLRVPSVEGTPRPDLVVRQRAGLIQVVMEEEGRRAVVHFPSNTTREQLSKLVTMVDAQAFERVTIVPLITKATPKALKNPVGIQVEDVIAEQLPGVERAAFNTEQVSMLMQFQREGVFKGQVGILAEGGYAVQVVKKLKNGKIQVRDPFEGKRVFSVEPSKIGLLPTTLEGNLTPNRFVLNALTQKERGLREQLFKLAVAKSIKPPTTLEGLESFASTRGYDVTNLGKGKVQIHDFASGESQKFADVRSAARYIRNREDALPDLTPPEIVELLSGRTNIGFGNAFTASPAGVQERIPTKFGDFDGKVLKEMLDVRRPATLQLITPTKSHLARIQKFMKDVHRIDLPFGNLFLRIDEGIGHRQNFMSGWFKGKGPFLPSGVRPLDAIQKTAGKDANHTLIGIWQETRTDAVARLVVEGRMTAREIQAAKDLGVWNDALTKEFNMSPELVTDFLPHIRRWGKSYGGDVPALWKGTRGALPDELKSLAKEFESGELDIFAENAFDRAIELASVLANRRFMKSNLTEAYNLLKKIPDDDIKRPLSNYLEAIAGVQFGAQKAMVENAFREMFRGIGITIPAKGRFVERLALNFLGFGYSATMAFRPGLAIRNLTQTLQTTWTMFGGTGDLLLEAIGRAGTRAGRDAAILDAAIKLKTGAVMASEDIYAAMPSALRTMSDWSMKLYNSADHWNRAVAYWTGRLRMERALGEYAKSIKLGRGLTKAKDKLMVDSGLFMMDNSVKEVFFQRLAHGPDSAARFFGKQAADVTQYLYGRGNQVGWLRTIPGRFVGQFGTWPMWYIDFVRRTTANMINSGHPVRAAAFLGRLGIANGAVGLAGAAVGINLWKWAGGTSFFYNGGPAFEAIAGVSTLWRGIGGAVADPDDPFAQSRITEGRRILGRIGQAFIPFRYVVKDIQETLEASTPRGALAQALGAKLTRDQTIEDQLAIFDDFGNLSTDWRIWDQDPSLTATDRLLRLSEIGGRRAPLQGLSATTPTSSTPSAQSLGSSVRGPLPSLPQPSRFPGESQPIRQ